MMKRIRKGEKGFTLVEMIVAMFIFGILATGMTTLMAVLIQNNEFSQDMTEATTLAENKMEVFKNLDNASIPTGWGWDLPEEGFWRLWEVRNDVPQVGLRQITVMVIWFDSKWKFHHVSLLTLKNL
jgi:type IV pilus assembly protein PilV